MRGLNIFPNLFNEIQKGLSDLFKHLHCFVRCLLTFYMLSLSFSSLSHLQFIFCEKKSVKLEEKHQKNTGVKPK